MNKDLLREIAEIRRAVREAMRLPAGNDRDTMMRMTLDAAMQVSKKGVNLANIPGAWRLKGCSLKRELKFFARELVQRPIRRAYPTGGNSVLVCHAGLQFRFTAKHLADLGLLK